MNATEISSIGIIGPRAVNTNDFRNAVFAPPPKHTTIVGRTGLDTPALRVDDAVWNHGIPDRTVRRLDRFTQLAVYAAGETIRTCPSAAERCAQDPYSVGLCIGNNYGGWTYVEPMMRPLYETGMKAINPYVATAWFPAAAQGEISIRFVVKGASKTFSVERLSSAYALEYGRLLVTNGTVETMIAGGVEAPLTPSVLASMWTSQLVSEDMPAGEAACFLALRKPTGANPQITGFGRGRDVLTALARAIADAGVSGTGPDLVLLDGPRGASEMRRQHFCRQMDAVSSLRITRIPVAQPLPFGETVGAAFAVQVATACIALEEQRVPVSKFCRGCRYELLNYGFKPACNVATRLSTVAVLGSDAHGQWMCAIVAIPEGVKSNE